MKINITVAVRDVVKWAKTGDLHPQVDGREYRAPTPEEGALAQNAVAKITAMNEVAVSTTIELSSTTLTIKGRIDSVNAELDTPELIEVKATKCAPQYIAESILHSHRLQLMIYGYLWYKEKGELPDLTLVHVDVRRELIHNEPLTISASSLITQVEAILVAYADYAEKLAKYRHDRHILLSELTFPKSSFRPGQRELSAAYWRAIRDNDQVLADVPTGAGKTISALFPALKSMANSDSHQVIYITAKGSGSDVVIDSLVNWKQLDIHTLHFAARTKICGCNGADCPRQKGFFDRVRFALEEALLTPKCWDSKAVSTLADKYKLCGYGLQKALADIADLVVSDFNNVIRPKAFFPIAHRQSTLFIDEIHNLLPRARTLFSAKLSLDTTTTLRRAWRAPQALLAKRLDKVVKLQRVMETVEDAEKLTPLVDKVLHQLEQIREKPPGYAVPDELLEQVFSLYRWSDAAQMPKSSTKLLIQSDQVIQYCWNPAPMLSDRWQQFKSVIGFSGTITPVEVYREQLGFRSDAHLFVQPSPFTSDQQALKLWTDIRGDYRNRAASLDRLADRIDRQVALSKRALIAVPSFAVAHELSKKLDRAITARAGQSVQDFISNWPEGGIAIAPMGGVLTEGVDYEQGFLDTVVVFSMGMPKPDAFTRTIERGYAERGFPSFQYAYQFPGLTRVLQAAGRLIRSDLHRGTLILADHRWASEQYVNWLPSWWNALSLLHNQSTSDAESK